MCGPEGFAVSTFAGSEVAKTRSRVAVATRTGTPDDVADARRKHVEAKIAAYVAKALAEAVR